MIQVTEQQAKTHLRLGNYQRARKLYSQLYEENRDNHFPYMIKHIDQWIQESSKNGIGEAQFPVLDERTGIGCLCSIRTRKKYYEGGNRLVPESIVASREAFPLLMQNWKNVTDCVAEYLRPILDAQKTVSVLNWGWDCWKPVINRLTHTPDERAKDPHGSSSNLAMILAMISEILQTPVNESYFFTGTLQRDGRSATVIGVHRIVEKLEAILWECPNGATVFLPERNRKDVGQSKVLNDTITLKYVTTLDEVLQEVFPSFKQKLIEAIAKKRLCSDWLELNTRENNIHILQIQSKREKPSYSPDIIKNIYCPELPPNTEGVILNGVMPNFLSTRLTPEYIRQKKVFFAVSLGADRKEAIVTARHAEATKQIGEIISFNP